MPSTTLINQPMSTLKTKVDSALVLTFLKSNFNTDASSLTSIDEGENSQAFSFLSENSEFIIRVNKSNYGFEKDKYAYEHFKSRDIPIQKTHQIGKLTNDLYYSITDRIKGKTISSFKKDEIVKFMPELIDALDAIHSLDIGDTQFGDWGNKGIASESNWKNYLLKTSDTFENYTYEGKLLEPDIVQLILGSYKELIGYCPNIRHLVHGDFGFNNLLSDGKVITGVIDWECSKYGDFLYDVAWLSFWDTRIDYTKNFYEFYLNKSVLVPNYHNRILCYKYRIGLSALRFYSDSKQENKYRWAKGRLLELIRI